MERMKKIRELIAFQRDPECSIDSLMNFVATKTLEDFGVLNIFLAIVRSNGALAYPVAYGANISILKNTPQRVLDSHTPGYAAFVGGQVVECGDVHEYPFYFPENVPRVFPNGFEYSIALPVPSFGAAHVFCNRRQEMTSELETYLIIVGEIFGLCLDHCNNGSKFDVDADVEEPITLLPLTPRQWAIKEAMLRGLTNGAIAKEMNFSESLIRHETIRIYSKLGINGRKELLKAELGNPESGIVNSRSFA